MTAYYNEIEPFAVEWLRNLIKKGLIANGEVDSRSIAEVQSSDLTGFDQCHFFAGIGVWSHALRGAGWNDDRPVWTGSCPCQPFSTAGKGKGTDDERHLWPEFFRLISKCRPPTVFGEQVAAKAGLTWFDTVSTDLEEAGYAVGAADLCAAGIGAPHLRQRLWFVANSNDPGPQGRERMPESRHQRSTGTSCVAGGMDNTSSTRGFWDPADWVLCRDPRGPRWRPIESGTFPLADGNPGHVGKLRAYGNSIVAPLAKEFIAAAMECIP